MANPTQTMFPSPPATVFLVGIGGIGMSGLAQLLHSEGFRVAGSDRQLTGPGREDLLNMLRKQAMDIFPQDGSGPRAIRPDAVIVSAAVEDGNPDLLAAPHVPRFGRAEALAAVLNRLPGTQIAVAGSCGKTTVTAWIASALHALDEPILVVDGGRVVEFEGPDAPGNFHRDASHRYIIYEVDESDRSLVAFQPDYGVLLNIGTDHHERAELVRLFCAFLRNCRRGAALHSCLREDFSDVTDEQTMWFGASRAEAPLRPAGDPPRSITAASTLTTPDGIEFQVPGHGRVTSTQCGCHSIENALAVLGTLRMILPDHARSSLFCKALGSFRGVRQRFEWVGRTAQGVSVYNDYAHNVEKIHAVLDTAVRMADGPVITFFQPHGFGPLRFMRKGLKTVLENTLRPTDRFVFLPVYYAGGTATFSPTSRDVAEQYAQDGLPVGSVADRTAAEKVLREAAQTRPGMIVVVGGRDPSLRNWAMKIADLKP